MRIRIRKASGNISNAARAAVSRSQVCRQLVLVWLVVWAGHGVTWAQSLTPIEIHGPRSNRVNLVILSEGYTAPQLGQFLRDVTNLVETFFTAEPYGAYRTFFNTYAISVASAQSGSDHPTTGGPYRDTYFNSAYEFYDYVITIPPNGLDPNPANGLGKVQALLDQFLPEADIVVLLVNDIQPGGSSGVGGPQGRGNRLPIITALNPFPPYSDIVVHESGHFFAGLVDEYTTPYPGYIPVEAPNATRKTAREEIPWRAWIEPSTPLPTPADWVWADVVGLFEGAQYHTSGWYRPKLDCKMRTLGVPFCEVCREQIVRSIYEKVRLWDEARPTSTNLMWSSEASLVFEIEPVQPAGHALLVRWETNGVVVPGATGGRLELDPARLGNGTHRVTVFVSDPTPWVRYDPEGRLRATRQWQVTISFPEVRLTAMAKVGHDAVRFTVLGPSHGRVVLERSSDLQNWSAVLTNLTWTGRWDFTNGFSHGGLPTFYRAAWAP